MFEVYAFVNESKNLKIFLLKLVLKLAKEEKISFFSTQHDKYFDDVVETNRRIERKMFLNKLRLILNVRF